jgi:hypothetical protein
MLPSGSPDSRASTAGNNHPIAFSGRTAARGIEAQALAIEAKTLPHDVLVKARQLLLDHLACMIAGAETPQGRMLSG